MAFGASHNSNGSSVGMCIIAWPILQISASIAVRVVSRLKDRDTYRIVRVPYCYNHNRNTMIHDVCPMTILICLSETSDYLLGQVQNLYLSDK